MRININIDFDEGEDFTVEGSDEDIRPFPDWLAFELAEKARELTEGYENVSIYTKVESR